MIGLRPRGLAAVASLVVLSLAGSGSVLQLYRTSLELDAQRSRKFELERVLREHISGLRSGGRLEEQSILVAPTGTLALAMLEARIRDTASTQGATVLETEPGSRDAESGVDRVSVTATITGRMTELQGLLYAMETDSPPVDILEVSMDPVRENPGHEPNPILRLRMQTTANWTPR
jgi:hypothetical protein